jgi:hypothetical protein
VRVRDAEDGHHLVAEAGCDRSAEALHGPGEMVAMELVLVAEGLRVKTARAREAGDQHGDRLTQLGAGRVRSGRLPLGRHPGLGRELERRLLAEDRRLQALQRWARRQTELFV